METRWLDERESRAWIGFQRLRADLTSRLGQELQRNGLSEAEYAVLAVISESDGARMRARDLAVVLGWDRSRISHQVRRMEQRGTLTREACPSDARGFEIIMTPAGRALLDAAAPQHVETVRHCFIDLLSPDELDLLARLADRVTDHLQTEHATDSPCASDCPSDGG